MLNENVRNEKQGLLYIINCDKPGDIIQIGKYYTINLYIAELERQITDFSTNDGFVNMRKY